MCGCRFRLIKMKALWIMLLRKLNYLGPTQSSDSVVHAKPFFKIFVVSFSAHCYKQQTNRGGLMLTNNHSTIDFKQSSADTISFIILTASPTESTKLFSSNCFGSTIAELIVTAQVVFKRISVLR